jgi:tetratricopeptide (TPR) repeat protein
MSRRRIIAGVLAAGLLFWTAGAGAEQTRGQNASGDAGEPGNELFLSSDPINAAVFLKNELIGKTPLRITGVGKGRMRLRIEKEEYEPLKTEILVTESGRQQFFFDLTPTFVQLVLKQKNQEVFINEKRVGSTPLEINNLPSGTYEIGREQEGISISYKGYSNIRRMVRFETYFSAGLLLGSLVGQSYFENNGNRDTAQSLELTSLVFAGLLGYNLMKSIKLNTAAKQQREQMTAIEVEAFRAESERTCFTSGMELIGRDQWEDALLKFSFVYNMFPDSQYTPISVYEIGYCHYMMKEFEKASGYFRRSVFDYPIYELFPYAVYYYLDSLLQTAAAGEAGPTTPAEDSPLIQAIADFERLGPVHLDDQTGELQKDYFDLLTALYDRTGKTRGYLLTGLLGMMDEYLAANAEAQAYPEVYLLKGRLLYSYIDRQAGLRMLNDMKKRYVDDRSLIAEIERIIKNG